MAEPEYPNEFAGLVQAATAAADQEGEWPNGNPTQSGQRVNPDRVSFAEMENAYSTIPPGRPHKRKRDESDELPQGQYIPMVPPSDSGAEKMANEAADQSPAAGNGIAAALFRQPTEKSKRYTRPPMSTLYTSLQLAPESFLRLQAAAKDFMLDDNFPERSDCVGQRGAGVNADMVKLKLWKCVKEFLEEHGHGERYWGQTASSEPDQPTRTLFWPSDMDAIIKLCVPLLRRMVTNERQRRYATVARKPGDQIEIGAEAAPAQPTADETSAVFSQDIRSSEIPDMLCEGSILHAHQVSGLLDSLSRPHQLGHVIGSSVLDDLTIQHLLVNVAGHLDIFHRGDLGACDATCQQETVARLRQWLQREKGGGSDGDPNGIEVATFGSMFEVCRSYIAESGHTTATRRSSTLPQTVDHTHGPATSRSSKRSTRATNNTAGKQSNGVQTTSASNLTIMVNIISGESSAPTSNRRIVPRFSLTPESATNLTTLRAEAHKRLSAVAPTDAGAGLDLNVKVWLPDGLVQIRDDGEWMIALLSAGMIEWMDGEVRVVIEV